MSVEFQKQLIGVLNDMPSVIKSANGYNYRYQDLPSIINAVRPVLRAHGMAFYQCVDVMDGIDVVRTVLFSELGSIESCTSIKAAPLAGSSNPVQEFGSGITYTKRYALASLCGIVDRPDDDANDLGLNLDDMQKAINKCQTAPELREYYAKIIPSLLGKVKDSFIEMSTARAAVLKELTY